MNQALPATTAQYTGLITDTGRWSKFNHRADDIFICTPPKCGTTWTQAIVCMLVFGEADHGQMPGVISPWIDAQFAPIDDYIAMIDGQTNRRFIKTHTPLDGIPFFAECTYLVVCRDPRDMYFSMLNHRDNMNDEELAFTTMPSGPTGYKDWIEGEFLHDNFDRQCLTGVAKFVDSYWRFKDLTNIHLYHYADMKRDLRGHISKVATALEIVVNDRQLDEMTAAATFEAMQKKGDQYAPGAGMGMWKKEQGFFANGSNAQWRGKLSEAELQALDAKLQTLLTQEQIDWLVPA